jgi:hypothetical protein
VSPSAEPGQATRATYQMMNFDHNFDFDFDLDFEWR